MEGEMLVLHIWLEYISHIACITHSLAHSLSLTLTHSLTKLAEQIAPKQLPNSSATLVPADSLSHSHYLPAPLA